MELGKFSEEAQAEIGQLFGKEPTPTPEPEASADETEEVVETDEETESDESSPDEEANEVDKEVDDSEEEGSQPDDSDIEYIKANGKKVKIDYSDRENIKRVYAMAAGARQWQAERDSLKTEKTELTEKYGELKKTMDYLESVKDNHAELFEAVTGIPLEDKLREWGEEQNLVENMSEAEKAMYLSNQDHQKRIRAVEKERAELKLALEDTKRKDEEAAVAKQTSVANPAFFKYNFDNELGNEQLELRLNRTLWSEAKTELSQFDEVTPDMVEEVFGRISNQIRQGFQVSSERAVKKAVSSKRKVVKKTAQKLAVADAGKSKRAEIDEKIKAGDIAGLLSGQYDLSNY